MWIQLDEPTLGRIQNILLQNGETALPDRIRHFLDDVAANQQLYDRYRTAARTPLSGEDEVDSDAVVSRGDDPGAYVMAWVWVRDEDLVEERPPMRQPGDSLDSDCAHAIHEECLICAECGKCREDLNDEDLCGDCVSADLDRVVELCNDCDYFIEPNPQPTEGPPCAPFVDLTDGEIDEDREAKLSGLCHPLRYWQEHRPDLFRKYPDGKIGPNSAFHEPKMEY